MKKEEYIPVKTFEIHIHNDYAIKNLNTMFYEADIKIEDIFSGNFLFKVLGVRLQLQVVDYTFIANNFNTIAKKVIEYKTYEDIPKEYLNDEMNYRAMISDRSKSGNKSYLVLYDIDHRLDQEGLFGISRVIQNNFNAPYMLSYDEKHRAHKNRATGPLIGMFHEALLS